jgi:type IV pilus assembly protein PilM
MLLGKKDHLVGLDIGSQSVKIAEIVPSKSGLTLKKFGIAQLSADCIEEGAIKDPEAVTEIIRQLKKEVGIREKKVAISIGGYSIIVKKINVQTMTEEKLLETIHFEAEQYIPFDINDVNLDFQILGENENNPNQMSVLLVAAKKDLIEDYINLVTSAKFIPSIIDVDAFALQNIYETSYFSQEPTNNSEEEDDEVISLIDIGASKTSLNILKGASSLFMRDISMGCGQISQMIASQIECSVEEAEEIKNSGGSDQFTEEQLSEVISSFATEWATEVRRAFDFFYSSFGENQIHKIILSGGGANLESLRLILSAESDVSVETINPFGNLIIDNNKFDASFLEKVAPQAAIAMGLALRRVDDK